MSSKTKLKGSFGSLIDTLTQRFDPLQPEDIVTLWMSLMTRCASCARDTEAWARLPNEDDAFVPVTQGVDHATRALVNADYSDPNSLQAALQSASDALQALEELLAT